jgi:hypothetical protein
VSRIEGLSDAVFGFAITLLVVSLGAPRTYGELTRMIAGFPAFVATFVLLVMVWLAQYKFFRRYGLEDPTTVRLNVVLLCFVVFLVYPLKFLCETFVALWIGPLGYLAGWRPLVDQMRDAQQALQPEQWPSVMLVFATGYVAVFTVFVLLHRHALRQADALRLDDVERLETRFAIVEHRVNIGVAVASVVVTYAVAYAPVAQGILPHVFGGAYGFGAILGGFTYALTGPVMIVLGRRHERRRRALLAARDASEAPTSELPVTLVPAGALATAAGAAPATAPRDFQLPDRSRPASSTRP